MSDALLPDMDVVSFKLNDVLHQQDDRIDNVYFPLGGIVSMVTLLADGRGIETSLAGREGMVGFTFLGSEVSPWQSLVQLPGQAFRMKGADIRRHALDQPKLLSLLVRYSVAMHEASGHAIACNRFHAVDSRIARWLLMTHDRVDGDDFVMTQEFLSLMLGLRRATVTVAMGDLDRAGVVRHVGRGRVRVTDRARLEQLSCECYERMSRWLREPAAT